MCVRVIDLLSAISAMPLCCTRLPRLDLPSYKILFVKYGTFMSSRQGPYWHTTTLEENTLPCIIAFTYYCCWKPLAEKFKFTNEMDSSNREACALFLCSFLSKATLIFSPVRLNWLGVVLSFRMASLLHIDPCCVRLSLTAIDKAIQSYFPKLAVCKEQQSNPDLCSETV